MEATHNSNNPLSDILMFMVSSLCFIMSKITQEQFRQWTWWGVGMIVFLFALIRDWKKVKQQFKDWFQ